MRYRRAIVAVGVVTLVLGVVFYWGNGILIAIESGDLSISSGTYADGSIRNSKRLPSSGPNFSTYSRFGSLLGRTCVHDKVRETILDAYARVDGELPSRPFVFGETGWPHGGIFWPHKTHQNGLSVDFMVPVVDHDGRPTVFPTNIFNKFGYGEEFDSTGHSRSYSIDFDAMAVHLKAIQAAAGVHGLEIRVVIFDTTLQKLLFASREGKDLPMIVRFSTKPAWVRHDEHYHIDFSIRG